MTIQEAIKQIHMIMTDGREDGGVDIGNKDFAALNMALEALREKQQREEDGRTMPTRDLVEELRKREGVETYDVDPYEDKEIKVNGPVIALVISD